MRNTLILVVFAWCFFLRPSTSVALESPRGLYEIGGDAWTNVNISGYKAELDWDDGNSADGVYDGSRIDGLVAALTGSKSMRSTP